MKRHLPLIEIHKKASAIFESCILKTNDLFLPSEIPIEVGAVLSKIIPQELAREGIEKLILTAELEWCLCRVEYCPRGDCGFMSTF